MTTRNPLILSNGLISEMSAGDAITASASIIISVLNQTGSTLTKGQAVYISGANGDNPTVSLASASAESTSSKTLGLVYADIANGDIGAVVTSGLFKGIDTSTATAGQSVWLSSTPGGLVFGSQPTQPLHGVFIGKVARVQQNNGSIFITIQNGYEISELHDVLITSPANNNLLAYDSATSLWKNVSAINGVSVGSTTAAAITGTTITANTGFAGALNGTVGATTPNTGAFTTLSASSTVTLSGGTANGLLYLNGSKAATSGSALTFNGTDLSSSTFQATAGAPGFSISNQGTGAARSQYTNAGGTIYIGLDNSSGGLGGPYSMNYWYTGNYPHVWAVNNSEQMRLNSTGLGIGTSSPSQKLDVVGSATVSGSVYSTSFINTSNGTSYLTDLSTGNGIYVGGSSGSPANTVRVFTNASEAARFDSSGNLGLGVTPSGWYSSYKAFQISSNASLTANTDFFALGNNYYTNTSGNEIYLATGYAAKYRSVSSNGQYQWFTAPSGTAGDAISFTQAMTLSADGTFRVKGAGTAGSTDAFQVSGSAPASAVSVTSGGALLVGLATTSYSSQLAVQGGIFTRSNAFNIESSTSGSTNFEWVLRYGAGMDFYVNGASVLASLSSSGVWTNASDARYKENVRPISYGLAEVMQLQPRAYNMIGSEKQEIGFVAQEVQPIIPELVETSFNSVTKQERLTLSYSQLSAVLVKAIHQQQDLIESLTARINTLEGK